ncbi:hypothetical protein UlMin_033483 [Ulmus minor]
MNLFKLPFSLIRELHRLCAQFWWGRNSEKKRMHWCTWEKLCVHKADRGMGFKDLRSFNRALLAKQAWRIHSSPTSLVSRVLKGFYFQTSSFLQVKAKSTSSFVWRSILWVRGLYMQGIRRKIGSGEDTFIYHDGWLLPEAILSLPLPRRNVPDSILWHYDKSGHYTVRSGYWLASENKGVPSSSTSSHTSWWQSFKLPPQCDFKEFLLTANDCLSVENLEFLCVLLWRIWFRRNKWTHEQIWLDDESCYSWARQHLEDFLDANCRREALPKKRVNSPWQAPPHGWVKINSDAAWCSTKKKFGLGTTIRDSTGKVLGSAALPIYSSVSVAVAETLELKSVLASEINYMFDSIYELCSNFQLYKFSHTHRMGNQVAHSLARLALSLDNEQIWPTGIPESIKHLASYKNKHAIFNPRLNKKI